MDPIISFPLELEDVKLLGCNRSPQGDFIIRVESTLSTCICHKCGNQIHNSHGFDDEITLEHLSIFDHRVYIKLRPKRFTCPYCKEKTKKEVTTTQQLSWYNPKSKYTKDYEKFILRNLINSTIEDISLKNGITHDSVDGIINRWIDDKVDWQRITSLTILGIDEVSLKKGHGDYICIISSIDEQGKLQILGILPNRKKDTVAQFFKGIPDRIKQTIQEVCSDLNEGFINAAKKELPNAPVVADRFHVAKQYRKVLDEVRKREQRRLKKELSSKEYSELKGLMWAIRKNQDTISDKERQILTKAFELSPTLKIVYKLCADLTEIFNKNITKQEAITLIKNWIDEVQSRQLKYFDTFIGTLTKYFEEITNYFICRSNSGFVEGLNNKIKVLKRRCFGIFDISSLFRRLWLDLIGRYRLLNNIPICEV